MNGSFKYLFSVKLHLKEPGVRTSSAYQPSTCMFLGPGKKGIPPHPIVPPHHPSPHPHPTPSRRPCELPKGWGEGTSLTTSSWQSFHRLSGVPISLPPCPPWCFPSPSAFCALQGQGQYWGCFSQECRDILPKYTETVLGLLNEPSHTQRTKKLRCQAWSLR
ncbi:rCG46786 [Rattus norvegicus]|uniref:RCG46786 n=1 Tax=Rattus norvegicus TaxID=10116 RepID=A6IXI3_RAT|nr:rCG46786 [Rattus norvegicus]